MLGILLALTGGPVRACDDRGRPHTPTPKFQLVPACIDTSVRPLPAAQRATQLGLYVPPRATPAQVNANADAQPETIPVGAADTSPAPPQTPAATAAHHRDNAPGEKRRSAHSGGRSAPAARGMARALSLADAVDATARLHDIDPLLLHAIARVESGHDSAAISPAGARGLLQLMPATAARLGQPDVTALHVAEANLELGARYLKLLQRRFGNDLVLVLASYNAGEGAVERHGRRVPPYRETQHYVAAVLAHYDALRGAAQRSRHGHGHAPATAR